MILQEQSFHPIRDREDYIRAAASIAKRCKSAAVYLYQSWSYENGSEKLNSTGLSFDEMHASLQESVRAAAAQLELQIFPVGQAHYICSKEHPEIRLYREDSYHPSLHLSFLAALTFYKAVYGKMPANDYCPDGIDDDSIKIFKNIVNRIGV